MATKRGDKSNLIELRERGNGTGEQKSPYRHPNFRWHNEYIERTVLPTDTLQGIALLYNTSVGEIKKLNQFQSDGELHARRVVKVPSKGVLIDLEPEPTTSENTRYVSGKTFSVVTDGDSDYDEECSILGDRVPDAYLNNKDSLLSELRVKVNHVAANSPILNGLSDDSDLDAAYIRKGIQGQLDRRSESSLKWWHVLFPCLGFVILFPILLFIFHEHLHDLGHNHDSAVTISSFLPTSEYIIPEKDS